MDHFFTQRGLKIRLNESFCFYQELKPNIDISKLLVETETYAGLKDWLLFVFGLIFFIIKANTNDILNFTIYLTLYGIFVPQIYPLFCLDKALSFFFPKYIFSIFAGFYIDKVVLIIVGLITVGWKVTLMFFITYYITVFICFIINFILLRSTFNRYGVAVGDVERIFINVSRYNSSQKTSFSVWMYKYSQYIEEQTQ